MEDEKYIIDEIGYFISERIPVLRELTDKFKSYHTNLITLENVVYWLLQFETLDKIKIAYILLINITYLDSEKISSLILSEIDKSYNKNEVLFCPIGNLFDSASMLVYSLAKKIKIEEESLKERFISIERISEVNSTIQTIVFIDDNITSGIQLKQFFKELFTSETFRREHIKAPLESQTIQYLKSVNLVYCVAIELGATDSICNDIKRDYELSNFKIVSGLKDYNNYLEYGNNLWNNEIESENAKKIVKEISYSLFEDKKNKWGKELLEDRLLGYGNLSKLTAFSHNIPKSLLPIFWKFGFYKSRPWFPLFTERGEWEQYKSEILKFNPLLSYVSRNIISGLFGKQMPSCTAFIITKYLNTREIEIELPNNEVIDLVINYKLNKFNHLTKQYPPSSSRDFIGMHLMDSKDYDRYNLEVDEFNKELLKYKSEIPKIMPVLISNFTLPIRVYNNGNGTANEVILILTLPDEIDIYDEINNYIPKEPKKPKKPSSIYEMAIVRPEVNYLARISNSISNNVINKGNRFKVTYENGKKIVTVYFGKILQHTFRDFELKHLVVKTDIEKINCEYKIICEESLYPLNEIFKIQIRREKITNSIVYELADQNK